MLLFLITCFFLILFYKSLPLKPLEPWVYELRLLSSWFWRDSLSLFPITKSIIRRLSGGFTLIPTEMSLKKKTLCSNIENMEVSEDRSVLDLPELALECVLQKLPPEGLCRMAGVCSSLRERCMSDHLWERHMRQKWGRIIGPAAHRKWQCHISSINDSSLLEPSNTRSLMGYLSRIWPLLVVKSNTSNISERKSSLLVDSTMSWYLALETGKFWFPAQVYNRENGHVGFMLSCYDAELRYDSQSDTFQARYPPHGRRAVAIESGVSWDRLRAPPMDTSPHDLHNSECLDDLRPGAHIEIQWRRNKGFPYGWWYGIIGHLESCDRNASYCRCHESESVVLEFNQYSPGSRWRCTNINRKDHREEGNEADGFYGGIRKLQNHNEISTWKRLWPTDVLE